MLPYRRTAAVFAVILPILAFPALAASKPAARPAVKSAALSKVDIRQAEQYLADLGYWTGPIDGVWDDVSRHALVAFQKIQRARPTGTLTRAEYNALSVASPPRPRELGQHIEVDLARQVLFLVDAEGRVGNILPISSGSGKTFHEHGYPETHAVTPCGHLEVFSKASGWKTSPLGEMYNPLYIVGGDRHPRQPRRARLPGEPWLHPRPHVRLRAPAADGAQGHPGLRLRLQGRETPARDGGGAHRRRGARVGSPVTYTEGVKTPSRPERRLRTMATLDGPGWFIAPLLIPGSRPPRSMASRLPSPLPPPRLLRRRPPASGGSPRSRRSLRLF